jgi:hypothetical protein
LQESFRLLTVGGEVLILDGNQKTLRHLEWLNNVFEEPYIREFTDGSVDAWMGRAGFAAVQTQDFWVIHQVTRGVKPLKEGSGIRGSQSVAEVPSVVGTGVQGSAENAYPDESWIPAPGY